MPTFQQTFANCPFPEGVLAVLGSYPVRVRVHKAQRAMEATVSGAAVPKEILSQAAEMLKRTFGLSAATVAVDEPKPEAVQPEPPAPASEEKPPAPHRPNRNSPRGWRPRWRPCAGR